MYRCLCRVVIHTPCVHTGRVSNSKKSGTTQVSTNEKTTSIYLLNESLCREWSIYLIVILKDDQDIVLSEHAGYGKVCLM